VTHPGKLSFFSCFKVKCLVIKAKILVNQGPMGIAKLFS